MKKNLLVFAVFLGAFVTSVSAQQEKLLTHFIFDKMSINPGSTGMEDGICGTLIYRNQWDKFNGAPNSVVFNAEANIDRFLPNSGAGISFYHDAIGFSRQNNVLLNYSYRVFIGDGQLGLGLGVGLVNFGFAPVWVPPTSSTDVLLPTETSASTFDANFGLYYKHRKGWYAGLSSTHLSASELKNLNFSTARHYFAMGGYRMPKVFGNVDLDFNALIRSDLKKTSADINVRAIVNDLFYGGLTYRTSDAIGIMAGINYGNFTFGYSYDITINKLSSISRGSHELLLKYCYFLPPPPVTITRNPRWL